MGSIRYSSLSRRITRLYNNQLRIQRQLLLLRRLSRQPPSNKRRHLWLTSLHLQRSQLQTSPWLLKHQPCNKVGLPLSKVEMPKAKLLLKEVPLKPAQPRVRAAVEAIVVVMQDKPLTAWQEVATWSKISS
jgi:hypothetical protein